MEQQDNSWYHGRISRDDAERILRDQGIRDGAFLVRESNSSEGDYVLSVLFRGNVTHYQIRRHQDDSFFSIDEKSPIHGLDQLIDHYRHYKGGLVTTLSVIVKNSPPPSIDLLNGKTNLLHRVISQGDVNLLQNVISDRTRNLEAKNEVGRTAAHIACIQGKDDVIATLLGRHVNLRSRDAEGNTPLHYACINCFPVTIQRLIDAGADIQARNPKNGHVPLHEAAKAGNLSAVKLLLGYNIPHMPRSEISRLPVDFARENNHWEVVKYLDTYQMPPPTTSKSLWFHGTLTRQESVRKLQEKMMELQKKNGILNTEMSPFETGVFLVRTSDTKDNSNKISLLFENTDKHFVIDEIMLNNRKYYFIDQGPYLPSLETLVEHYQRFADGLPTNLRYYVVPLEAPPIDYRTIPRHKPTKQIPMTPTSPVQTLPTSPKETKASPKTPKSGSKIKNIFSTLSRRSDKNKNVEAKPSPVDPILDPIPITFTPNFSPQQDLYQVPPEPKPIDQDHYIQEDTTIQQDSNANWNAYQNAQVIIIPNNKLTLSERLGEGEFGCVYRGFYEYRGRKVEVAIKTLNKDNQETDRKSFLAETELMMNLHHPCIVKLIGISEEDPMMMVQELVPFGAMLNYLQANGDNITNIELKYLAIQIASGMNYLVNRHFVHRDLAARNILLQSRVLAKITDFGLSRCFSKDKDYYAAAEGGKWPIKWYAPESYYHGKFSHASDIWSFGVTLWEMYSRGEVPYGDTTSGSEAIDLVDRGERLQRPDNCPLDVYQIMLSCWEIEPKRRPTFQSLIKFFQRLQSESLYSQESDDGPMKDTETEYMTIHDLAITLPIDQNFNQPQTRLPLMQVDRSAVEHRMTNCVIDLQDVAIGRELGTGNFGTVCEADWQGCKVAAKKLCPDYQIDRDQFVKELSIMIKLSHSSIVKFIGVIDEPKIILLELVQLGSMLSFLQTHNPMTLEPVTTKELALWAYQITDGMNYIGSRKILHRDLAARNVLLQSRNQAKVSDFGLSEFLPLDKDFYKQQNEMDMPLFWYAIESFQNEYKFSASTDVWSFGVTLWEMYSYGAQPYENMNVSEMIAFVSTGKRLQPPSGCPATIYSEMLRCWNANPTERPSFNDLTSFFKKLENTFEDSIEYLCSSDIEKVDVDQINANIYDITGTDKIIDIADVTKEKALGGGEFGKVYSGFLYSRTKKSKIPVAIKTLNQEADQSRNAFLQEFSIMVNLNHPSIIKLIGIVTGPPLMIIQELATDCLQQYLQTYRNEITPEIELKLWAYQVASGMNYLVSKRFVHRDLAARNILLLTKMQAKISDFGLSRVFNAENEYQASNGGLWPLKWYAPESFRYGRFSHASDVWSFGVFLWELYSFGKLPFDGMDNEEVSNRVEHGLRLPRPPVCPQHVYATMRHCWEEEPRDRPKFSELMDFFAKDYLYQNIQEIISGPNEASVPNEINI